MNFMRAESDLWLNRRGSKGEKREILSTNKSLKVKLEARCQCVLRRGFSSLFLLKFDC